MAKLVDSMKEDEDGIKGMINTKNKNKEENFYKEDKKNEYQIKEDKEQSEKEFQKKISKPNTKKGV